MTYRRIQGTLLLTIIVFLLGPRPVHAHCDSLDGPVVKAAQDALQHGSVDLVLIWVQPRHEPELRAAFERTMVVRSLSPEARELSDRYFFETVVRLHREGEGAPYTGLKPAGRDLGPAIPAADAALESGTVDNLRALLIHTVDEGLAHRYRKALDLSGFGRDDVEAGRAFVTAYVQFVHYVENVYETSHAAEHAHAK